MTTTMNHFAQRAMMQGVSCALIALFLFISMLPKVAGALEAQSELPDGLAATEPVGAVTLPDAIAAAFRGNPDLRVFSAEIRAREAATIQAGLRPNPALRAEIENVGGSGQRRAFQDTETTLLLSQLVE